MNLKEIQKEIHETATQKGWWTKERNDGECIALMHSELSEALEWLRKQENKRSDHIPEFLGVEEELADCIIRILDFACARGLDIEGAMLEKMKYNKTRSFKHGKKF